MKCCYKIIPLTLFSLFVLFFFAWALLSFVACGSDNTDTASIDIQTQNGPDPDIVPDSPGNTMPKPIERTPNEKKADTVFVQATKEKIDKSPNKDKSCEEILKEYEQEVEKSIAVRKITPKLQTLADDVPCLKCRTKDDIKAKFDLLDERLEEAFEK